MALHAFLLFPSMHARERRSKGTMQSHGPFQQLSPDLEAVLHRLVSCCIGRWNVGEDSRLESNQCNAWRRMSGVQMEGSNCNHTVKVAYMQH